MVGHKCLKEAGLGRFLHYLAQPVVISMFGRLKAASILLVTGKQCE